MQLITYLSAVAAAVATVSADRSAVTLAKTCDTSKPYARIINRCPYTVNLWSVLKGQGCPDGEMVTLKTGEIYAENYAYAKGPTPATSTNDTGISIKISKTNQCKGNDITQLEYFMDNRDVTPTAFQLNYFDVSYVDCVSNCPTKQEGYYLAAGSATARAARASADNSWCPVMSCSDSASCAKMSYILPDDVETKTCDLQSSMDFYMCGSQAGDVDTPAASAPASSSQQAQSSAPAPKPSTTLKAVVSSAAVQVKAAAVTTAAQIKDAVKAPKVKTQVVYVTAVEYVNAKKREHAHVHAHARRHQPFHA